MKSQPIFYCSEVNYPVGGLFRPFNFLIYPIAAFFPPHFSIITFSKEKTWNLEMQITLTLLHISISHKITTKGLGDHSQITIIHAIRMDNWKLATLYQFILNYNQFIRISQAYTSPICKSEIIIQPKNS